MTVTAIDPNVNQPPVADAGEIRRWAIVPSVYSTEFVDALSAASDDVIDVQMVVDGPAAAVLGELVRERWRRAEGTPPARPPARWWRPPTYAPASCSVTSSPA